MVLREAAVMGTPTLVVAGSNPAEVIRHGENGFAAADTTADMAAAVAYALSDRQRLKRIGECARQTIPLPWEKLMDDVQKAYTTPR